MSPLVRRTWAIRGQTPVLHQRTRSHKKVSAIGAVAIRWSGRSPRLMFRLLKGQNMDSALCIEFLKQLLQNIRGHVIVVWDRLQAHRSKKVTRWLQTQNRIKTEFFPPYAPELNPVEYVWGYLKTNSLANFTPMDIEELYGETKSSLCAIRRNKTLLKSFVKHSAVNFF